MVHNDFLQINNKNAENLTQKRARNLNRHLTKENNQIANKHVVVVI